MQDWIVNVNLVPGRHEYKFIIDGVWRHDKHQPIIINRSGGFNNTITVNEVL